VSDAEAATLPTNGLTALLALDLLDLTPGSTIAITGVGGGLGAFLVQLGSHRGLRVVTVTASADDERLRSLGAGVLLDRGPRTPQRIREAVPEGVQALVDTALIGPELAGAVADGGTVVAVRGPQEPGGYDRSANPNVQVRSISVGDYLGRPDKLDELRDLAEQGVLTPRWPAPTRPNKQLPRIALRGGRNPWASRPHLLIRVHATSTIETEHANRTPRGATGARRQYRRLRDRRGET
jgi:NADPH:quinone reductase-like Zn-dependent oxidoreductase